MTIPLAIHVLLFGALGLVAGAAHFLGLQHNTRLYLAGGPRWRPIALHLGRTAVTVVLFILVARHGALPLLVVLVGFMVARTLMVRTARSRP